MGDLAPSFRVLCVARRCAALQAALLAALILKRPVPLLLAALVTAASIAVHYVHAAGAIAIALVSLALAWSTNRGAFRAILIGLAIGDRARSRDRPYPDCRTGGRLYDVNWIAQSGGGGASKTWPPSEPIS